jgi:hypothetical protein
MKVDITFPFRVHGTMVGKRAERLVCASYVHAHELRVVDAADTSVVLEAKSAYESTKLGNMQDRAGRIGTVMSRPFELRRWNGRLFSWFCPVAELASRCGLDIDSSYCDYGLVHDTISMTGHATPTMRLYKFLDKHFSVGDLYLNRAKRRDPKDIQFWVGDNEEPNRDRPPFHKWCSELTTFSATDMEDMRRHYEAIADRLLVIGSDVWIEVRSPCIAVVTMAEDASHFNWSSWTRTYVYHGVLPDLVSNHASVAWFNLDQGEEALAFARRWAHSGREVVDLRLPIECDEKDFSFDVTRERLWQLGYILAIHCKDAAMRSPGKFSEYERPLIEKSYEEACKTNGVLQLRGAPEVDILRLLPMAWRTNHRSSLMTVGLPQEKWKRRCLDDEVIDLIDNQTIDIYRLG